MAAAGLAALLPILLLVAPTPLYLDDPTQFAALDERPAFRLRIAATLIYFPSVIAAHWALGFLVRENLRPLYWLGLLFFAIGNALDILLRSIQFFVLHEQLGSALDEANASEAAQIWAMIEAFSAWAPAFSIAFGVFFGCARILFSICAFTIPHLTARLAAAALLVTGLQNLLPRFDDAAGTQLFGGMGMGYIWIWLAGILLIGLTLWRASKAASTPNS